MMDCPFCGTSNRGEARFCKRCGSLLLDACPRCGVALPEAAVFCDRCGFRLVEFVRLEATPSNSSDSDAPSNRPFAKPVDGSRAASWPPAPRPSGTVPRQSGDRPTLPNAPSQPPGEVLPGSDGSDLNRYMPQDLVAKLDVARASGKALGERKLVTILFTDIVGSTALAEELDPEEWGEVVSGAHRRVSEAVYRYEGTIAQLLGDGVLAFFGAPITHEDDPARAVNAALDILREIDAYREELRARWDMIDFQMRVGLNTGLVVVGDIGSDMHMEYMAIGDAINLASRMEQSAAPNTIQIAQDTYKHVKSAFEFEALGEIEVKGKSDPVTAYRVLGRKEAGARLRGIEGLHAEMVGRRDEMDTLSQILGDLKQGLGRIVCILGEAGLGKSRLIAEAHRVSVDRMTDGADWFETTTLSYEANQAYGLFQRLIRGVTGIRREENPQQVGRALASIAESLPEPRRHRAAQVLETLFGLQSDGPDGVLEGETFKRELLEVVHEWWRGRFSVRPGVLVFDDMHWSDTASIDLLLQLLPLTEEIPLVLVFALRAERQAPAWRVKTAADDLYHHRYTEIGLQPLSEDESNELVDRLLAIAELPDRLRASILEKSAGNPFFIEEVVRALIDNGAVVPEDRVVNGQVQRFWKTTGEGADFPIPDNLRSLLGARMDRLEETTRATLQMASVIGRSFYLRVLQAMGEDPPDLDKNLGALLRLDMIRELARVPEVEYAFRNPLTQEAVYRTILLKRRREFHRRVGESMELLYPDRLDGLLGLLAHHFSLAGERTKAIEYSRQASRQAVALYAFDDAVRNLQTALQQVKHGEQSEFHLILREELGDVYSLLRDGDRAIAEYQQALSLWHALGGHDSVAAVRLHRKIVQVVTDLKWSVSLEHLQEANEARLTSRASLESSLSLTENEPAHLETVRALVVLSMDAWRIQEPSDWEAAERFAQAAVTMAEKLDSPVDLSRALGALASVLDGRSRLREHLKIVEQRLMICSDPRFEDVREKVEALRSVGAARMYVGEYSQALTYLTQAEELARTVQATDQIANALGIQAQCLFRSDRWDEVLAIEEKWRDLERQHPRERVGETCFFVALSASVHALRGDRDRAKSYAEESYDYMLSMSGQPEHWQRNQFY